MRLDIYQAETSRTAAAQAAISQAASGDLNSEVQHPDNTMLPPETPPLPTVLAALREVLAQIPDITLALLFGSLAAGRALSDSDLDISVRAQHPWTIAEQIALTQALAGQTGRAIDLIDLATAPEPLLGQIVQTGRRIAGSDNTYARLIQRHLIEQADFMPYRNRVLAERRMAWISK